MVLFLLYGATQKFFFFHMLLGSFFPHGLPEFFNTSYLGTPLFGFLFAGIHELFLELFFGNCIIVWNFPSFLPIFFYSSFPFTSTLKDIPPHSPAANPRGPLLFYGPTYGISWLLLSFPSLLEAYFLFLPFWLVMISSLLVIVSNVLFIIPWSLWLSKRVDSKSSCF